MKLNNTYYLLRHGQALSNIKQLVSCWPEAFENPLTDYGRKMVQVAALALKKEKIDEIFSSDLLRTKQTADIVAKELGIIPNYDERLREIRFSGTVEDFANYYDRGGQIEGPDKRKESYESVMERMADFLNDIDKRYKNKNILIISHQGPLLMLEAYIEGSSVAEALEKIPDEKRIQTAELRKLNQYGV